MNKKRLFYDFLQKHNALEAYKRAFKTTILRYGGRSTNSYIPLGGSFIWGDTPEGQLYWYNLDVQWERYYKSMKKKYHF